MFQADLIFDVGMHLGEDTDFYLKKGFRVVAFEANPDLLRHCQLRFAEELASGKLTIVSGAVAAGGAQTVPFYVNITNTTWGTLHPAWVARNERYGAKSRLIEVQTVDIVENFHKYGVPYYLKIDVEGSDTVVAQSLRSVSDRPHYISIETDINRFSHVVGEIELLRSLGYRRFKPVQQANMKGKHVSVNDRDGRPFEHFFEMGATGPFGDDLPGEWLDHRACRRAYRSIFARYWAAGHLSPFSRCGWHKPRWRLQRLIGVAGWHDLHASL